MLIPMAEHDVAQKLSARLSENFSLFGKHSPCFLHPGVIEFWQQVANRGDAVVEGLENFLTAGWLREVGKVGRLRGIFLHEANDSAGHERPMVGKLSCRRGLFVWLPCEFVFGRTCQKSPSDGGMRFTLCAYRFCDR